MGDATAPALAGPTFWRRWRNSNLNSLAALMRASMPPSAPGSLGSAAYLDIVSYLLSENGSPDGDAPLEADRLEGIRLTEPAEEE